MTLSLQDITVLTTVILTATTAILGYFANKNSRAKNIAIALAAAERMIDAAAYTDGTLNTERESLALAVLDHLMPSINPNTIKAELEAMLGVIHENVQKISATPPPKE